MTRCSAHADGEPIRIEAGLESFHVIRLTEQHDMCVFFCRGYDRATDAFVAALPKSSRNEMAKIVKDWRIALVRAHPRLFVVVVGKPEYLFGSPPCEVGWRDIIERMGGRIENELQDDETFEFVRIRQKFGILRVNWDAEVSDDTATRTGRAIDLAVARSAWTCEICGSVGRLYSSRGWLSTRCTEHRTGDPAPLKIGWENIRLLRRRRGETGLYYARYDREVDTLTEIVSFCRTAAFAAVMRYSAMRPPR